MGEDNELIAASTAEQIAKRLTFRPEAINQIKTAIVEACINASEHSFSPDRKIYQRFRVESDRLVITISSRGVVPANLNGAKSGSEAKQAAEERRGWGLKLIRTLMDEVEFERVDDGTSLRMTKYLRPQKERKRITITSRVNTKNYFSFVPLCTFEAGGSYRVDTPSGGLVRSHCVGTTAVVYASDYLNKLTGEKIERDVAGNWIAVAARSSLISATPSWLTVSGFLSSSASSTSPKKTAPNRLFRSKQSNSPTVRDAWTDPPRCARERRTRSADESFAL